MPRRAVMVSAQCRLARCGQRGAGGHVRRPSCQSPPWSCSPHGRSPSSWSLPGPLQRSRSLVAGCAAGTDGAGACGAVVVVGGTGTCAVVAGAAALAVKTGDSSAGASAGNGAGAAGGGGRGGRRGGGGG